MSKQKKPNSPQTNRALHLLRNHDQWVLAGANVDDDGDLHTQVHASFQPRPNAPVEVTLTALDLMEAHLLAAVNAVREKRKSVLEAQKVEDGYGE